MIDRGQLPVEQTTVMVWVLYNNDDEYTYLGTGSIEIITDAGKYQSLHYVEVTNPENNLIFLRSRLQSSNVYERQKSTVITWSDPEQDVQNNIGISFEDQATCDMYWRIICSKVGKNYLQINGRQKLLMPNEKNLRILLEKMKTSYNLVAYHVLNSQQFMGAFWATLHNLYSTNSQIKGITVIRQLLFHFDPKIMQVFLSDPNFFHFLQIYECTLIINTVQTKINFKQSYEKTTGTKQIVELTEVARKRILLALRSKYVKEYVIDHSKDITILNMLNQIIKENQIQALIDMLKHQCIEKIVALYQRSKAEDKEQRDYNARRLLTFLLESAWILRIHHADNTKSLFVTTFYKTGMLRIMAELLNQGFYKALEVLSCLAALDKTVFLNQFTEDYRNDSGNSIMRIIGKQFSESPQQQIADETIDFLKNMAPILLTNKTMFQFFNKTTIYTIFACCKFAERMLPLIIVCVSELKALKSVTDYIIKFKYLDVISQKMEKKQLPKKQMILVSKFIRLVMQEDKQERSEAVKLAYNEIVKTKIFYILLVYLNDNIHQNSLVTSSIMGTITFLSTLDFNQLTKEVKQFKFGDTSAKNYIVLKKPLDTIFQKQQQSMATSSQPQIPLGTKRPHKSILQDEQQQKYLQQEQKAQKQDSMINEQQKQNKQKGEQIEATMKKLMQIKTDIKKKQMQQDIIRHVLKQRSDKLKAEKKMDTEIGFQFDQDQDQF